MALAATVTHAELYQYFLIPGIRDTSANAPDVVAGNGSDGKPLSGRCNAGSRQNRSERAEAGSRGIQTPFESQPSQESLQRCAQVPLPCKGI
jgi:hypothetical protein